MGLLDATDTGDGLAFSVEPEWLQGRTAYGGASAAMTLTAAKSLAADLPPLRSAQLAFAGPLTGRIVARPAMLRRGRNTAFVACDLHDENGIGVRAMFLFMAARESIVDYPPAPSPAEAPSGPPLALPAGAPRFMQNFDVIDAGPQPTNGWLRWLRVKSPPTTDPEASLLLIADALPPAAMALARPTGPVSTTTWQVNLTGSPPDPAQWLLIRSATTQASAGASAQRMDMWSEDGTSIAHATQSVALFY